MILPETENIYKPRTSSNTRNKNVDTSPKNRNDNQTGQFLNQRVGTVARARETIGNKYHKKKMVLCKQESKGISLSAEQEDWLHDTDDEPDEQELEAHYMYMAKIQEVTTEDSGPTYDSELLEKVYSVDKYNVFANERQHSEQPESINDTYVVETVYSNVTPNSSDMCDNEEQVDQNAENTKDERMLLASLITNFIVTKAIEESKHVDLSRA
ncbi:hypothetical protein Tco_0911045 [Tanacetum coccineum]|uniref:Uncharacterized protein n=1 Tax=Tanacetum coccineum TaxID=301880 RepID=A0ABQ5CUN3_9ASTR